MQYSGCAYWLIVANMMLRLTLTTNNNKAIADYTLPLLSTPVTPSHR